MEIYYMYKPENIDFAFFICPPNRITDKSKKIIDDNNITLFEYFSPNIEELVKTSTQKSTTPLKLIIVK